MGNNVDFGKKDYDKKKEGKVCVRIGKGYLYATRGKNRERPSTEEQNTFLPSFFHSLHSPCVLKI